MYRLTTLSHAALLCPPPSFLQNWGFPTYNWEEMAKDGYGWWRRRLTHMAQ